MKPIDIISVIAPQITLWKTLGFLTEEEADDLYRLIYRVPVRDKKIRLKFEQLLKRLLHDLSEYSKKIKLDLREHDD